MLINEASKKTNLTKKAIEYYAMQGLIVPQILDNGYRNYSQEDVITLSKICVLRKLDISIEEIRSILADKTNTALQAVAVKKELDYQRDLIKKSILQKLSEGNSYEEISIELQSVEQGKTITDKLLDAFPGYYGRFVCMHFARFLNEPISTETQRSAYETIISFLDNMPDLDMPKELEEYLFVETENIGTEQITNMLNSIKASYQNPDKFLAENKEALEQYMEIKKSDVYKNSPAAKWMNLMKEFNRANGYDDIFIPAMKQLSPSYAEYFHQLEIANKKFLDQYPQIEEM